MEQEQDKKVAELKERLSRGEYAVDPSAVAEAILRRSRDMALLRAECLRVPVSLEETAQSACSKPVSGPAASVNVTPAGSPGVAWTARPIQVMRTAAESFVEIALRAAGGTQTQSS
jgi:hypothetical protein